jgi:hypothetical protein
MILSFCSSDNKCRTMKISTATLRLYSEFLPREVGRYPEGPKAVIPNVELIYSLARAICLEMNFALRP